MKNINTKQIKFYKALLKLKQHQPNTLSKIIDQSIVQYVAYISIIVASLVLFFISFCFFDPMNALGLIFSGFGLLGLGCGMLIRHLATDIKAARFFSMLASVLDTNKIKEKITAIENAQKEK